MPSVEEAIEQIKDRLKIPVVWNTGGYEKVEAVERISKFSDIFLQDLKFFSSDISGKYAFASDYFKHAVKATERMVGLVGSPRFDADGILQKGIILRHLVLPSNRRDSIELLRELYKACGSENIILSLMSQYTPTTYKTSYGELGRKLTDFEYRSVCETALDLGFRGYFQERDSAVSSYTPIFDLAGL